MRATPDGGQLAGSARVEPLHPGIAIGGALSGGLSMLKLSVDTGAFEAGERYEGAVKLDTNAGEIAVPLSFSVRVAWGRVATWAAAAALLVGSLLGFIRATAADSSPVLRGFAPEGAEDAWGAYLLLLAAVTGVALAVRKFYRAPVRRATKALVAADE